MSIRRRLIKHLMVLFTASWLFIIGFTFLEAHHEVEEVFDSQLAQAAGILSQLSVDHILEDRLNLGQLPKDVFGHKYERNISFQIWENERLVLHSQSAPTYQLATQLGFSDVAIGDSTWRVFSLNVEGTPFTINTGESYEVRNELINHIAIVTLVPLIWAIPLLGVIIWFGIGRGLEPLKQMAQQVSRRSPEQLNPIEEARVPEEIIPLVGSLNSLLQRLKVAFEKERTVTADTSHEIRTPLAGIKTQAQVALRSNDEGERNQALKQIVEGVDRSTRLVEQMLTLARLDPETVYRDFHQVDLSRVAERVMGELAPMALKKDILLSLDQDNIPNAKNVVHGHPSGLEILIRNLLDNSIRHTPPKGEVSILLTRRNDHQLLKVMDNGPGLPQADRQQVLEGRYIRSDHKGKGRGLGLSIVRKIARLHQADLEMAESPSGKGLEVTLSFKNSNFSPSLSA